MEQTRMMLYFDMDGVLADFDRKAIELIGKRLRDFTSSVEGWAVMEKHQDIYYRLEKMPDADQLVHEVFKLAYQYGYTPGVLTAIPKYGRIVNAVQHKRAWLAEKFPLYPELLTNFNIGPHAVDKQNHCKFGHILIDDSVMNIPQWNARNGFGILHTSAADTIKQLKSFLEKLDR